MTDLIPELTNVTPEHAFMFMLLERVNALEDGQDKIHTQMEWLQQEIPNCIPYEWYCYHFSTPTEINEITGEDLEVYFDTLREKCMDVLFHNRSHTNPEFAYWHWYIKSETNQYELRVYIRYRIPISKNKLNLSFDEIPNIVSFEIIPLHGGSSDIRMMLTERLGYTDVFPYSTPDFGVEIWRRGGDSIDFPLEETWTQGRFTVSPNYKTGCHQHFMLRDRLLVMIRMNRWTELFRLSE